MFMTHVASWTFDRDCHHDRRSDVIALHKVDRFDLLRSLGSDGEVTDLLTSQSVRVLTAGDVNSSDVVGLDFTITSDMVFCLSVSILQTNRQCWRPIGCSRCSPSADTTQEVNQLGGRIAWQRHRLRHLWWFVSIRAVQHDGIGNLIDFGINQNEWHTFEDFGSPVGEDQLLFVMDTFMEHRLR